MTDVTGTVATLQTLSGKGWSSLLKLNSTSFGRGANFCKMIENEFEAVTLINEINKERRKRGLSVIPASDDMCVTALFKGFTQKVSLIQHEAKRMKKI